MARTWTDRVANLTTDYESVRGETKLFTLKGTEYGGDVIVKQTLCDTLEIAQRKMNEGVIAISYKHPNIVETLNYAQEPAPQGKFYVYVIMRKYAIDLQKDADYRRRQQPLNF